MFRANPAPLRGRGEGPPQHQELQPRGRDPHPELEDDPAVGVCWEDGSLAGGVLYQCAGEDGSLAGGVLYKPAFDLLPSETLQCISIFILFLFINTFI